jgi:hypothetical protein
MSISRNHESAIVVTPATLKQQIIIRLTTLVNKQGGEYYFFGEDGYTNPVVDIEGMEVHGLETKGRDVYLLMIDPENPMNNEDYIPYNANEFYIEQLWSVYMACEPIYSSKFNDYATFQE